MTILEMIAEWKKGCSCAPRGRPAECLECTEALISAIENSERRHDQDIYTLPSRQYDITEADFDQASVDVTDPSKLIPSGVVVFCQASFDIPNMTWAEIDANKPSKGPPVKGIVSPNKSYRG